jgi:hypothetical protein
LFKFLVDVTTSLSYGRVAFNYFLGSVEARDGRLVRFLHHVARKPRWDLERFKERVLNLPTTCSAFRQACDRDPVLGTERVRLHEQIGKNPMVF